MTHRRAALYLQIPAEYCRPFGGMRWAQYGEAVEFLDGPDAGRTFVFAAEIGQFLEGLIAEGAWCPAFGSVLHLMLMLGMADRVSPEGPVASIRKGRLADPFRELGRPLRNAGALFADLLQEGPGKGLGVPDPPGLPQLLELLNGGRWIPMMVLSHPMLGAMDYAEQPSLTGKALDKLIASRIDSMSDEGISHWLKFGRGPLDRIEDPAIPLPPIGLAEALLQVEDRPRLAGLSRLVARLEGALSLPPRRLDRDGLQIDGYWDLATRGAPERLLPFQFALEDDEFLRRFAADELLYFHRERPARPVAQELVLVLDQGVRTWGDVRLVLAGAAMAMARQAGRRGVPVRLTTTGMASDPVDPSTLSSNALGPLLEASDLTPNPSRALARVLRDRECAARDVVLLTHPRSLSDPELVEAARGVGPTDAARVFAVTVDDRGEVGLSELKQGRPVALGRCRVEVEDVTIASSADPGPVRGESRTAWRGDVEAIPFPFRCGLPATPASPDEPATPFIDFDEAGGRLLSVLSPRGLYAFRVDGTDAEILPRPVVKSHVMKPIRSVIGVSGGFVIEGRWQGLPVLAHYDFDTRTCAVIDFPGYAKSVGPVTWYYYPDLHSLGGRPVAGGRPCMAVDLSATAGRAGTTARASQAAERARAGIPRYAATVDRLETQASAPWSDLSCHSVALDPHTGTLTYRRGCEEPRSLTPRRQGAPALKSERILSIRQGGDVLAVLMGATSPWTIWFIAMSRGEVLGSMPCDGQGVRCQFALSRDGLRFALGSADGIEVRDVPGARAPVIVETFERLWNHDGTLGRSCFLVHEYGQARARRPEAQATLIRWDAGRLAVDHDDASGGFRRLGGIAAMSRGLSSRDLPPRYDLSRFVRLIEHGESRFLLDRYNQVAVLDRHDRVLAMFYLSGREFAAWMPDGTRMGSNRLNGGEPTPGAAERIAAALRAAEGDAS